MYTQIADDLRAQIAAGALRPGDDVPTEADLA
ncbi:GntR family transcriptional regulator, partial [Microbacterium maritypicum]